MKKMAINQSNYIPWKGYFDIIHDVDLFIFGDNVQYTHGDWRNRNKIKTPQGARWLTIPVGRKIDKVICEVEIKDTSWTVQHWNQISLWYSKSLHFKTYEDFFKFIYLEAKWDNLSALNQYLIKTIATDFLGIKTEFKDIYEFHAPGKKFDRVMNLMFKLKPDVYVSGPAAKNYIDEKKFEETGVQLVYKDYSGYPEYPQQFPPFDHYVTILDLLFNCGPDTPYYIWGWRDEL